MVAPAEARIVWLVMAGLVPAIHALPVMNEDVDHRDSQRRPLAFGSRDATAR
jgi:hypothetical protein